MTISIWRYSHLTLAISSFLFIFTASITGIILAFEPISDRLKPFEIENVENQTLANTISALQKEYDEIVSIKVDENNFVIASVITKDGKNKTFYTNPFTGKRIGNIVKKVAIFKWATNLHRSLFLKSTGRFLVGFFSFLLALITITGSILIIKRQGGIKRYSSKIVKEHFEQYYHIIIGRYALIPILIITLTGVFISLEKFSLLPKENISHQIIKQNNSAKKIDFKDFEVFKTIHLSEVKSLEFPFSKDKEDYFFLKTQRKELIINQYSGEVIGTKNLSPITILSNWSLLLHTGRGTIIWSIILMLSCFAILFFIYSGFKMTLKRKQKTLIPKNKFNKDISEYIILVGSENGSTFSFASLFYNALIAKGKKVFISELNKYSTYKKAKYLIIFTATYGNGEAPSTGKNFEHLFLSIKPKNKLQYSILGFGSLEYPNFCKYAIYIDSMLQLHPALNSDMPLFKINNQSFDDFKNWCQQWSQNTKTSIEINLNQFELNNSKKHIFNVINRSDINKDKSFLLELKPKKYLKFKSGDLLSFKPNNEVKSRLYSIGKIDKKIILSVKKRDFGLCTTYFSQLKKSDKILASIQKNKKFHFPKKKKEVIMIANGTGIAPFLGMLNENTKKRKVHLFWGGRTTESIKIYSELIYKAKDNEHLSSIHIAYSQEESKKEYVQDLVKVQKEMVATTLKKGGIIMICGSITMMEATLKTLNKITLSKLNTPLSKFENFNQIKTDCY